MRSPDSIIARVHWEISSRTIPRRKTAMASAAICSSDSANENTSALVTMRSRCVVFGMTTRSC